jgi:uncharacterized protein (DUF2267 family)
VDFSQLLREVQDSGGSAGPEEAEALLVSVLRAMAEVLPQDQLEALASQLPPEAALYLRRPGQEPDPLFDSHLFLGWVVSSLDATGSRDKTEGGLDLTTVYSGEEAIRRCRCVFSVLKRLVDEGQHTSLAASLPDEVSGWFAEA